jgi:hypothetical protein
MRYAIRSYPKPNGTVSYELYDVTTQEVLYRDDSYHVLRAMKKGLEKKAAA